MTAVLCQSSVYTEEAEWQQMNSVGCSLTLLQGLSTRTRTLVEVKSTLPGQWKNS